MINDKHLAWLESRGISAETAVRHSVRSTAEGAIGFPFFEDGKQVGEKFRGAGKKFWQAAGGKKVFWNADVLDDPVLALEAEKGGLPLIITEGEIDALTALECGYPLTVSVPEGAPNPDIAEGHDDSTGKFQFMFNARDKLKKVKRFILAVDSDPNGRTLAAEKVRRLGASRCMFVTYPEDEVVPTEGGKKRAPKDLNEVLMYFGADAVRAVLDGAKPYPVKGLYKLEDYPPAEPIRSIKTGWATIDKHLSLFPGAFTVVTGIPGQGKTTWTMGLSINIARNYGWKTAVFSPEMPTVPHLHNKLRTIASGLPLYRVMQDRQILRETDQVLIEAFVFLDADPDEGMDEDMTLEWVIDRAHDAVHRHGIKHLIIDPWNEVEHAKPPGEAMPDYIGRGIRMLKRFAKERQVAVTVIVHPTKAVAGDNPRMPNLYDCEGSAHWYNKPDLGVVVGRDPENPMSPHTVIRIAKVRFKGTGMKGDVLMQYDNDTERFLMLDPSYQGEA